MYRFSKLLIIAVVFNLLVTPGILAEELFWSTEESSFGYIGMTGRVDPDSIGGEIGGVFQGSEYFSGRLSLALLYSENIDENFFTGANLGLRISLPYRISPFLGIGAFGGYTKETISAEDDFTDNNDDGIVDEHGEEKEAIDEVLFSIYPEVGLIIWITESFGISGNASYQIASAGRDHDYWYYGGFMTFAID